MKKILFLSILVLVTIVFNTCEVENPDPNSTNHKVEQNSSISFKQSYGGTINGEYWNNAFYGSAQELGVAFGDLDGDEDLDMIQGSRYRLEWVKNVGTNISPEFEDLNWGNISISYVNFLNSPYLVDIDDDNDLDLFCGRMQGDISFWENSGDENSPNFGNEISNYSDIQTGFYASISFCDIDNDNDYDLFVGDYYEGVIHYYKNIGTSQIPLFEEQPNSLVDTIQIKNNSLSPEFVDIDSDGDFDLFIGTEWGAIYYYENLGNANNPSFTFITDNYNNINIGWSHLNLKFADIDNDSDKDMFITDLKGYFFLYENIGNKNLPVWHFSTSCFNKILNFGRCSGPASGDIDNDGDNDIVFGANTILKNVGTSESPEWVFNDQLTNNPDYTFSMFTLVDIDNDNDLDLFCGDVRGYILFYNNTGKPEEPNWSLETEKYANIEYGSNTHVSVSFADIDDDLDFDMFVQHCIWQGGYDIISFYENIGNANQPQWSLITNNYINIKLDAFSKCNFGDIDNDGDYDCLVGRGGGGAIQLLINEGDSINARWVLKNGIEVEGGSAYATPILVDLNNDSYPEIISGHSGGGLNFWWNESVNSGLEIAKY